MPGKLESEDNFSKYLFIFFLIIAIIQKILSFVTTSYLFEGSKDIENIKNYNKIYKKNITPELLKNVAMSNFVFTAIQIIINFYIIYVLFRSGYDGFFPNNPTISQYILIFISLLSRYISFGLSISSYNYFISIFKDQKKQGYNILFTWFVAFFEVCIFLIRLFVTN
jgi:hypothetical protein